MFTAHRAPAHYKLLALVAGIVMALAMLSPHAHGELSSAQADAPATALGSLGARDSGQAVRRGTHGTGRRCAWLRQAREGTSKASEAPAQGDSSVEGFARGDVVVIVRGGEVVRIEQILHVQLQREAIV